MAPKPRRPTRSPQSLKGGLEPMQKAASADRAAQEALLGLESSQFNRAGTGIQPLADKLRKRMTVKKQDSLQQIADATLAAAIDHLKAPDAGTQLYADAFMRLSDDPAESLALRNRLLSVLSERDQQIVRQAFETDVIEGDFSPNSEALPYEGPTQAKVPDTVEERARAAARAAMEQMGAEAIPIVDLDKYLPPKDSGKTVLPVRPGDKVRTVSDTRGWTDAQVKRGYRQVLYAPSKPGSAPVSTVEVVASRKDEFSTKQPPRPGTVRRKKNPNYGETRQSVRIRPQPTEPSVERIAPNDFNQLSPDAQAAAVRGGEIMEFVRRMEAEYDPDFASTAFGERLLAEMNRIAQAHPEAIQFINDPNLASLRMPSDAVSTEPPRVNAEETISYRIGDETQRNRFEGRADRRTRDGIPADAPNRQMWREVLEIEGNPAEGGNTGFYAALPPSDEIAESLYRPVRQNLTYEAPRLPPPDNSPEARAARAQAEADAQASAADREAELDAQYEASRQRIESQGESQAPAPVEDTSSTALSLPENVQLTRKTTGWTKSQIKRGFRNKVIANSEPGGPPITIIEIVQGRQSEVLPKISGKGGFVLEKGTGTGSPSAVKSDRDFALREGRSAVEKLREKLFRMATQTTDASVAPVSAERMGVGEDFVADTMDKNFVRKKGGGTGGKRAMEKPLDLNSLVPQWGAFMYFADGDQLVLRRPNAVEIANELAHKTGLGQDIASGLVGYIQQSMDALEGVPLDAAKHPRAAAMRGQLLAPSEGQFRALEKRVLSQRDPRDSRPLISQESIDAYERQVAEQFKPVQQTQAALPAPEPETPAPVASRPAGGPFSALLNRARDGGSTATSIAGLIAALGIGSQGQAEAGELPPLESLAMMPRPPRRLPQTPPAGQFTPVQRAPAGTTTTVTAGGGVPVQASGTPAPQAATPAPAVVTAPAPAPTPMNMQALAAAATPAGPAPTQAVVNAATPQAGKRTFNEYFSVSPTYKTLAKVLGGAGQAGRYLPDLAAATAGVALAPMAVRGGVNLARFVGNQYSDMLQGFPQQPDQSAPPTVPNELPPPASKPAPQGENWEQIFDNIYGTQPDTTNKSTSTVNTLMNMLARK